MDRMPRQKKAIGLAFIYICSLMFVQSGCNRNNPTSADTSNTDSSSSDLSVSDFSSANSCQTCHPNHYNEWSGSMHAYALKDPVFSAVRDLGQSAYALALDGACTKCHSPLGQRSGEIEWGPFDINTLPAVVQEGVGCDLCHTITALDNISNAGIVLTPGNVKYGSITDPVSNNFHESEFRPLYQQSEYCGACHDLITGNGLELEAVFREWQKGGFAVTGKDCFDCHMETYQGPAALGGPTRTVHRHNMVGADVALIDFPFKPEQMQLVTQMLRSAITLQVIAPPSYTPNQQYDFQVNLLNENTGHNVPTGVPFNRQMWLSIEIRDQFGDPLYLSGDLDANGDLKNDYSAFPDRDFDLFNAQATMLRADSTPTGATWEAAYLTNPSIRAGELRTIDYGFQVPSRTSGDLTLIVKLRFRSFPPYVFRGLGLDSLLPIPIIDMAEDTITIQ
jgi:hypothetical protein